MWMLVVVLALAPSLVATASTHRVCGPGTVEVRSRGGVRRCRVVPTTTTSTTVAATTTSTTVAATTTSTSTSTSTSTTVALAAPVITSSSVGCGGIRLGWSAGAPATGIYAVQWAPSSSPSFGSYRLARVEGTSVVLPYSQFWGATDWLVRVIGMSTAWTAATSRWVNVTPASADVALEVPQCASSSGSVSLLARTISIDRASYTDNPQFSDAKPTLTSTASAGSGTKTYASSTTATCTINATTGLVNWTQVGTCTLSVTIASDGTYAAATSASISFEINFDLG